MLHIIQHLGQNILVTGKIKNLIVDLFSNHYFQKYVGKTLVIILIKNIVNDGFHVSILIFFSF